MKPIEIRDQVYLGPARVFRLCLSSMYYRLTRSTITVLILSLAVAFMSYVLLYGIISNDTKSFAFDQVKETRFLGEWVSRITAPDMEHTVHRNILSKDDSRLSEYMNWGGMNRAEIDTLNIMCGKLDAFYSYFNAISGSSRDLLLAGDDAYSLAVQLSDKKRFQEFSSMIAQLRLRFPLGSEENLKTLLLEESPRTAKAIERIRVGHQNACNEISALNTGTIHEYLAEKNSGFIEALGKAGFNLSEKDLSKLAIQAKDYVDLKKVSVNLENPDIRNSIARLMEITASDVNIMSVMEWAQSRSKTLKAAQIINESDSLGNIDGTRLFDLLSQGRRTAFLQKASGDEEPYRRSSVFSLPSRTLWLILVSFLVCVIGISNTMLMSVTDRFSEIATMKCLGAVDGFIMALFVFEAMIQGIIGSFIGVIIGVALSLIRAAAGFGGLAFEAMPLTDVIIASGISFIMGIVIAGLAATWPSWAAARLAPMEAMRVE